MGFFEKCCCCIDFKSVNCTQGGLCLICALIGLFASYPSVEVDKISLLICPENTVENDGMMYYSMLLGLSIFYIIASICLIIGSLKANGCLIGVFLIVNGINIVLIIIMAVYLFVHREVFFFLFIFYLIVAGIAIFMGICPYGQFLEVRRSSTGGGGYAAGYEAGYSAGYAVAGKVEIPA